MSSKRLRVTEDTQIHSSTTYTRNKGRQKKKKANTTFNWVIKGILISSTLVSSVMATGATAYASTPQPSAPPKPNINMQDAFHDEVAMISNLKMANRVLEAAIRQGELTPTMYTSVTQKLTAIDTKLALDGAFSKADELLPILEQSDIILKTSVNTSNQDILSKRNLSIESLESVQAKLGIKSQILDQQVLKKVTTEGKVTIASIQNNKVTYTDYQNNQYWSQDMLWSIDKGLIQGYMNAPHPSNKNIKQLGNWLDPQGNLTEAQMLTILMRYSKPDELKTTKPTQPNYFASVPYQLASKYQVPTKGSLTNTAQANQVVTRGDLAQALATLHFGKPVSKSQAVQFMYDANISSGLVINGQSPKTYASFGVNDSLKRAHIVSFMKRYDTFLNSGSTVKPPVVQKPDIQQPSKPGTGQVVQGIQVKHGNHTYGSQNQQEYDKVMEIVNKEVERSITATSWTHSNDVVKEAAFEAFFRGERGIKDRNHPDFQSDKNRALIQAESFYGKYLDIGMTRDQIFEFTALVGASKSLDGGAKQLTDGTPRSAYDSLVRKISDCDPRAYIMSAVFDSKGYTTAVLASYNHAYTIIKIDSKTWVDVEHGEVITNLQDFFNKKVQTILHQPTDGTSLSQYLK